MGSAFSALGTPSKTRSRGEMVAPSDCEENEDVRPAKRRRTSLFDAAASRDSRRQSSQVTRDNNIGPRSGKIQAVQPSDFYGKFRPALMEDGPPKGAERHPKKPTWSINNILPKDPVHLQKALRLDITSVVCRYEEEEAPVCLKSGGRRSLDIKCRCMVALFFGKNDENPAQPISQKDYTEIFRDSRLCILRTMFNDEGELVRELVNLEPFAVPSDKFYVNRKKRNERGQFVYSWGFAEGYYISIALEPAGWHKEWPPFDPSWLTNRDGTSVASNPTDLLKGDDAYRNSVYLLARMNTLFEADRQDKSIPLKLCYGTLRQNTPYVLRLEIKWSQPSHLSNLSAANLKKEASLSNSIVAGALPVTEAVQASPSLCEGENISASSKLTDSRTRRQRSNVTTYNLKTLSALQQGKSPRTTKNRDVGSQSAQGNSRDTGNVTVTYAFGQAVSADLSIKRETIYTGLICLLCHSACRSLDDLRYHLNTCTKNNGFKFSLRRANPHRIGFFVDIARQGLRGSPSPFAEQTRTLQLSQPRTLFDPEKFFDGDESWVRVREGPQHNLWAEHLQDRFHESSLSSSPNDSRHSSPNTSNDTDDVTDLENYLPKPSGKPPKKYHVPRTSKPLYHTITKQILEPGSEQPDSDDEKDESWLHHKHRDIIMDYGDVTDDEKDFIIQWNPFIMEKHLTCEAHLGDAVVDFVETKKSWFAEKSSRKREWAKFMEPLLMRGVVNREKCFDKCIEILMEAEKSRGSTVEAMEVERVVTPAAQRGALDCACGRHTQPPDRVICRGAVSGLDCQTFKHS
jgi:hypothetical protein